MARINNPHENTVIRKRARPFAGDAARLMRGQAEAITQPVTCTINGQEAIVERGSTIFEACMQAGIYVPHYCYDPSLTIVASCRLCLVEVEKVPKPVPSCMTTVAEGNVIYTDSPKVVEARNWQMELLLTNHPLDCPVCDQGGHCQLQRYSMDYGTTGTRFRFPKRVFPKPDLGPFVDLERNRCVLCTRCVRFMDEVAGSAELEVMARGNDSYIGTFQESPLENEFSGNTIDLCPVGCLTDKVFRFRARVWELRPTPSICPHCAVGCSIEIEGRDRDHELVRVTPRLNPAVNGRWICDKGRFGHDFVNSGERESLPLVKRDGKLLYAEDANPVDLAVERLKTIKDNHGGRALAGLAGADLSNETYYAFQWLMREVLDCPNIDHRTEHLGVDGDDGYLASIRLGAINDPIDEVEGADTIFLIGSDLPEELPILNLRLRQRLQGGEPAELLVAANRGGAYETLATEYIRYRPGSEGAFAICLFTALLKTKKMDVPGELAKSIDELNMESCLKQTGVPSDAIERLANRLAKAQRPTVLVGEDIWSAADGVNTVTVLADLCRALGLVDENRIGLSLLLPHANSRGAIDTGVLPHLGPGLTPIDEPGLGTAKILEAVVREDVKGLVLLGTDLLNRYPDRALVREALAKAEFVLAIGAFRHESAESADVFLPVTLFSEEDGSLTNVAGRVQRRSAALGPLSGTALPSRVLQVLAQRLGASVPEKRPEELFADVATDVSMYADLTWIELGETGMDQNLAKAPIFGERGGAYAAFETPLPISSAPDGFPLQLVQGRRLWDQGCLECHTPALVERSELDGGMKVLLAATDAEKAGVDSGAEVTVASPEGSVRVKVEVTGRAPEGCAVLLGSFDANAANELTTGGATHVRLVP